MLLWGRTTQATALELVPSVAGSAPYDVVVFNFPSYGVERGPVM